MGEAADDYTDSGLEMLALHQRGACGEVGLCSYCIQEELDEHQAGNCEPEWCPYCTGEWTDYGG